MAIVRPFRGLRPPREIAKDFSNLSFGRVKIINRFVKESVAKWMTGNELFPFLLQEADNLMFAP